MKCSLETGDTGFKIAIWELSQQTSKCPLTQEGDNPFHRIFFVHRPLQITVEWNAKKMHKVNKKVGWNDKSLPNPNPKKGGH